MIKKLLSIFLCFCLLILTFFCSTCTAKQFSYNNLRDGLIKIEFYSEERIFHRDGSCDDTVSILHVLSEEEIEVCIRAICDSTFYYDRSTDKAYPGFIFYYEDITKNTTYNEGRIYLHYNNPLKGNVSEGYWKGPILDLLDQYINKYID